MKQVSMIRTVRAAAFAVAAFAFAGAALWGTPVRAQAPRASCPPPPISTTPRRLAASDLGLNDRRTPAAPAGALARRAGRPRCGGRDRRRRAGLPRQRGLFRGARRAAPGPARRRRSGDQPRRLGPLSGHLCGVVVQHAAILLRPPRPHPARRPRLRRLAPRGRGRADRRGADDAAAAAAACLWYHATYVSPSWGRRLAQSARIGLHIFYS